MSVTIYDVAKLAKVSPSWVSWSLRDHPRAKELRPETRERIQRAAQELGYRRNVSATTIRTGFNASTVALLTMSGEVQGSGNFRIINQLNSYGYGVRIYFTTDLKKAFEEILSNQIRYVICNIAVPEQRLRVADFCRENNIRVVFLGSSVSEKDSPVFGVDTKQEMFHIVARFCELGHKKIALLCGPHRYVSTMLRHQGYLDSLAAHGIPADSNLILCADMEDSILLKMLEKSQPTALACIDGIVALKALNCLLRHGIRVPDEISLLGITGREVPPALLNIGRMTEPEYLSSDAAIEYLLHQKCQLPMNEKKQFLIESVYYPGETEGPVPEHPRKFRNLMNNDIFRRKKSMKGGKR